ncbi:MAG: isoleucine--tRNA ligase [Gammaproteobacteria bacterium]|nr:MAG: isoleucine--tRNA ligase [Gammaproteobacteria bacterium]
MTDYKQTLNLPQTNFPMKANLANRELLILDLWNKLDIYKTIRKDSTGKKTFYLHDGPPYANGDIHIGHAVNKVIKDIIVKSKQLENMDSPYIPGWDCHGLPIELNVEKKTGKAGHKISKKEFRQKCRDHAKKQIEKQKQDFIRLGIIGDWQQPYLTMDFEYEANIIRTLGKMLSKGHLDKGFKPVHWCFDCGSALAEAEVEYKDKESTTIDVAFKIKDNNKIDKIFNTKTEQDNFCVIWTTTAWTIPANKAVCVNPNFKYVLLNTAVGNLIIATDLIDDVSSRCQIENKKIIGECLGADLEGLLLEHALYPAQQTVPIILGDHVTTEAGTGAVHTAPGHGIEDYTVGKKYNLEIYNPVMANGVFKPDTPLVGGQHISSAADIILTELKKNKVLLSSDKITHSYPHCWRHRSPVIFRATAQWFVMMDKNNLRTDAIKEIENVKFVPEWGKSRIEGMVKNRPDWCISRQRSWGTPIPFFIHNESGQLHPDSINLIEKIAKLVQKDGIDAWFDLDPATILNEEDCKNYTKISDTLDVWFDSGSSFASVLQTRDELEYPADLYLEGSDQHRGWFQSSLLNSVAAKSTAPYKGVLTHGFTVDAKGHKMSKSLGNVISPQKIMKTLGADIIRLWIMSADYQNEMTVSDEILRRMADSYRRIRNTARFLLSNTFDYDERENAVSMDEMLSLDLWILEAVDKLQSEVQEHYKKYQFHQIFQKVHNFCALELGSFYLDIIKDRQYTCQTNSKARRSAQTAMAYLLQYLVRMISPFLSFTAEEIWQCIPNQNQKSVFLSQWMKLDFKDIKNTISYQDWQEIIKIRIAVSKKIEVLRADKTIGSALQAEVILYLSDERHKILAKLKDELKFVLITSDATIKKINQKPDDLDLDQNDKDIAIEVKLSKNQKCVRCWHHNISVGGDKNHPELCSRCIQNIESENGERREFA